jgi:hypothetical protein
MNLNHHGLHSRISRRTPRLPVRLSARVNLHFEDAGKLRELVHCGPPSVKLPRFLPLQLSVNPTQNNGNTRREICEAEMNRHLTSRSGLA